MTSEYVEGREAEMAEHGTGGPVRRLVHAVLRREADGPPPWTSACGKEVADIRGSWDPDRGFGEAEVACPACLSRLGA
jgi:hypothetical protein